MDELQFVPTEELAIELCQRFDYPVLILAKDNRDDPTDVDVTVYWTGDHERNIELACMFDDMMNETPEIKSVDTSDEPFIHKTTFEVEKNLEDDDE